MEERNPRQKNEFTETVVILSGTSKLLIPVNRANRAEHPPVETTANWLQLNTFMVSKYHNSINSFHVFSAQRQKTCVQPKSAAAALNILRDASWDTYKL